MPGKQLTKTDEPSEPSVVEAAAGIIDRRGDVVSRYIHRDAEDVDVVAESVYRTIIEEIMSAPDADSVLFVPEPEKLAEFVGRHLRLDTFKVNESEFDEGPPIYFTLKVWDFASETKHLINTGEQSVMAQVMRLQQLNAIPFEFTVLQAKRPNRFNRFPLKLTKFEAINV